MRQKVFLFGTFFLLIPGCILPSPGCLFPGIGGGGWGGGSVQAGTVVFHKEGYVSQGERYNYTFILKEDVDVLRFKFNSDAELFFRNSQPAFEKQVTLTGPAGILINERATRDRSDFERDLPEVPKGEYEVTIEAETMLPAETGAAYSDHVWIQVRIR